MDQNFTFFKSKEFSVVTDRVTELEKKLKSLGGKSTDKSIHMESDQKQNQDLENRVVTLESLINDLQN